MDKSSNSDYDSDLDFGVNGIRIRLESARIERDELASIVRRDKDMISKNLHQLEELMDISDINDQVMMAQATEIDQLEAENDKLKLENDRLRQQLKAKDAKLEYLTKLIEDNLNRFEESQIESIYFNIKRREIR